MTGKYYKILVYKDGKYTGGFADFDYKRYIDRLPNKDINFITCDCEGCKKALKSEWTEWIENLEPCKSGYHVIRKKDIAFWAYEIINKTKETNLLLYEVEIKGDTIEDLNKVVCNSIRFISAVRWRLSEKLSRATTNTIQNLVKEILD